MIGFEFKNNELTITADTLAVSAFSDIWEFDQTQRKNRAKQLLKYIFFYCEPSRKNPCFDIDQTDKDRICRRKSLGRFQEFTSEEIKLVEAAKETYAELTSNALDRMLLNINSKIDQINALTTQQVNAKNLDDQLNLFKSIKELIVIKKNIEEYIKVEEKKSRNKGGLKASPLESGLIGRGKRDVTL